MNAATNESDALSLVEVIHYFNRYWKVVALLGLLGGLLAWGASALMTPLYRSETVVAPSSQDASSGLLTRLAGQFGAIGGLVGDMGLGSTSDRRSAWIATLRSRAVLGEFVESRQLMPVLFADKWDESAGAWQPGLAPDDRPTVNEAVELIKKKILSVEEDKRSGLVTVGVRWREPSAAAAWANEIVRLANDLIRERVIDENRRYIAYLEAELRQTTVLERQQIIYRLMESRTSEVMLARGQEEYAFKVIDRAVAPDEDQYVRPQPLLYVAVGFGLGVLLGLAIALLQEARRAVQKNAAMTAPSVS
jgi:uncharacterized protein involved in exopolysaccharide biosynthesis